MGLSPRQAYCVCTSPGPLCLPIRSAHLIKKVNRRQYSSSTCARQTLRRQGIGQIFSVFFNEDEFSLGPVFLEPGATLPGSPLRPAAEFRNNPSWLISYKYKLEVIV